MMGVYSIKNKINGKIYIGQSKNIKERWYQHKNRLLKNEHVNTYLQNSWNKYGGDNFEFNILKKIKSELELNDIEKIYIKKYKSNNAKYGYNLTSGGEGYSLNEDVKRKISISQRGHRSELTISDVRRIKLCLYCLMDRREICDIFDVSYKVLGQIALGNTFSYVCSELNDFIYNMKQRLIDKRNEHIIELFDSGNTITEISKNNCYSMSIVEKCVYKYRNSVYKKKTKYQDIYDKVFELKSKGINNYQISKRLNISPSTVHRYVNGLSNPYKDLPYKKITENMKGEILYAYFYKNMTSYEIGEKFDMSATTVMSFINNYKYANTEVI